MTVTEDSLHVKDRPLGRFRNPTLPLARDRLALAADNVPGKVSGRPHSRNCQKLVAPALLNVREEKEWTIGKRNIPVLSCRTFAK